MSKVLSFLKRNWITVLVLIGIAGVCLWGMRSTTSAPTIAVIDTARLQKDLSVYQQLVQTKGKYLADEKNAFESEKAVLVKKDKALYDKWEKLSKKKGKKSAKQNPLKKEVDALRSQIVELQQRYQNKIEKIEKSFAKVKIVVHHQAVQMVHQWGKEKGYVLVMPKHMTFYAQDSIDKTDEFIKWFNQKNEGKIKIPTLEESD